MLATQLLANEYTRIGLLPRLGGWVGFTRFKTRWYAAKQARKARRQSKAAHLNVNDSDSISSVAVSGGSNAVGNLTVRTPIVNTPAAAMKQPPFSLQALVSANAAAQMEASTGAATASQNASIDRKESSSDETDHSCRRRRWRIFHRRRCHNDKPHTTRLPRYLRRFAKHLKLDAEQRQQLLQLALQTQTLRREFSQRGGAEVDTWVELFRAERFDSEAAAALVHYHSQWWQEKIAELLKQYEALHDGLQADQREQLVRGLQRLFRHKRRRF